MKKLFVTFFITLALAGFGVPKFVLAMGLTDPGTGQSIFITTPPESGVQVPVGQNNVNVSNARLNYQQVMSDPNATDADRERARLQLGVNQSMADNSNNCGAIDIYCNILNLFYFVVSLVGNFVLELTSWLLWASGVLLNMTVVQLVVNMKNVLEKITVIYSSWTILRDFANMFFIFILLVIAIQTILQTGDYKKLLTRVVLVALFINFSFFFTGVMIDFSNTLALLFYNGFTSGQNCGSIENMDGCLSLTIVQQMKLTTLFIPPVGAAMATSSARVVKDLASFSSFLIRVVLGSWLMIVVAGVFLASAVLIIYRFVTLLMLLMFSPLAFAAKILPNTEKYWKKWWNLLTTQLIFAPVYFMFLWITMRIITSGTLSSALNIDGNSNFGNAFSGNPTSLFGLTVNYIIVISLLGFSLKLASELGASGTEAAGKLSKGLTGTIGGWLGKHSYGRLAENLDKRWQKKTGFMGGTGFIGSHLRNVTTKPAMKADMGFGSWEDRQKSEKERLKANAEQIRKNKNQSTYETGIAALENAHPPIEPAPLLPGASAADTTRFNSEMSAYNAYQKQIQDLADLVQKSSTKDLTEMKANDIEKLANAGMLMSNQVSAILDDKNEKHNSAEKDSIRESYSAKAKTAVEKYLTDPTNQNLERAAKSAIGDLGEDGIKLISPNLTSGKGRTSETIIQMSSGKQYQEILKKTYGDGKKIIRDARFKPLIDPSSTIEKNLKQLGSLDGADLAYLFKNAAPGSAYDTTINQLLNDPGIVDALEPAKLAKAVEEGLDSTNSQKIKQAITDHAAAIGRGRLSPKHKKLIDWMRHTAF